MGDNNLSGTLWFTMYGNDVVDSWGRGTVITDSLCMGNSILQMNGWKWSQTIVSFCYPRLYYPIMCTCHELTYLQDEEEDEDLDKFPPERTDTYINWTSVLERGCPVEKIAMKFAEKIVLKCAKSIVFIVFTCAEQIVLKRGEEIVLKSASSYLT